MRKYGVIEISDKEIKIVKDRIKELKKHKNFYCTYGIEKNNKNHSCGVNKTLRKVNLDIIIEGEEIFVHNIVVPKVSKSKLHSIIKNQVMEIFHNIENIIFDYEIIDVKRKKLEVAIYCINAKDSFLMNRELFLGATIKSIMPIQQLYVNKYKKKIKNREFTIIIYRNEYVYIVEVRNKIIRRNRVINGVNEDINLEILEFLKVANNEEKNKEEVYIITEDIKENIKIVNSYEIGRSFLKNCN